VQQYQQMLEDCQAENEALRKQIVAEGKMPVSANSAKPRTLRELLDSKPSTAPSRSEQTSSGPDLLLPVTPSIDLGTEFDPAASTPEGTSAADKKPAVNSVPAPPGFAPGAAVAPGELPEPDEVVDAAVGDLAHQKATQIKILAVGPTRATSTMPAGLLIAIEPRSARGGVALAPAGAKMSLMIVAGPKEEPAGRWDYTVEQTASAYRDRFGGNSGWRFVVPFDQTAHAAPRFKLYARLVLPDGSKLLAEREFDANSDGASVEEVPSGDAGWFRSRRPIAALAGKLSREARIDFGSGGPPSPGHNTAPEFG
jgi:hypothetical protein